MVRKGEVRDQHVDYLLAKVHIPASDFVQNVGTPTASTSFAPASLNVGWSVGSPSYVRIPGTRTGGILLVGTTPTIDYRWRVPSEVDKNHPIYIRPHWTSQISGLTPTVGFGVWFATITSGTSLIAAVTVSPTTVLNTVVPDSSNTGATGTAWSYNLTGRGAIAPLATGVGANQVVADHVEAIHFAITAMSANWAIAPNNLIVLGMDLEYTPRKTFGDGSRREGRKTETNLGFSEVGSTNAY